MISLAQPLRIAIIGAGISGLACAQALKNKGYEVSVFEKSRGVSGRSSTRKLELGNCDHGAQYFTVSDPAFKEVSDQWFDQGIIEAWHPKLAVIENGIPVKEKRQTSNQVMRFVGVPGMTAMAQEMAKGLQINLIKKITRITKIPGGWQLFEETNAAIPGNWAGVVFAIPAPQISPILGLLQPAWMEILHSIKIRPCWTVMASTEHDSAVSIDAAFINSGPLAWIANNRSKPKREGPPIWTLHASADWSEQNLNIDPQMVKTELVSSFESITSAKVTSSVTHRWLYAKAHMDMSALYLWDSKQNLGACGDWLSNGNIEAAYLSGVACAHRICETS